LLLWFVAAVVVAALPAALAVVAAVALLTLIVAPMLYPTLAVSAAPLPLPKGELALRMLLGALLTLAVTTFANTVGTTWSGIAALAPVLTPVLAVFIHRRSGSGHAISLLANLARGLYSLTAFCFVVAWLLPRLGTMVTFSLALLVAIIVQTVTYLIRQRARPTPANS
jgi:hypothetical protein